ncbi:MAG: aryl-sulfate sulfotransferase, partial [Saprospiraceae bacterium]|nr:aryl-sulfate sulfotransferase [Saprospiraceae bacterium]
MKIKYLLLYLMSLSVASVFAQVKTVGLLKNEIDDQGYILFTPLNNRTTYLINRSGEKVHSWTSDFVPGMTAYLAEDGSLFRAGRVTENTYINSGGAGGIIEQMNWEGEVVWTYTYSSPDYRQHHDFEILPNGNILLLAWQKKTKEEAIAAGRDPSSLGTDQLWPDHLVEIKPYGQNQGEIVWEWQVWDHLVQNYDPAKDNYGDIKNSARINLNHYQNRLADWIHGNAIEYNENLDQIMLSSRGFNELWIIDHSTTMAEAKSDIGGSSGKGGDLLWRWGNPSAISSSNPQILFGQHGMYWKSTSTGQSEVYIYNNGNGRHPDIFSTIERIEIECNESGHYPLSTSGYFLPEQPATTFIPKDSLSIYAPLFSNVLKMDNDHTLVCVGPRGIFIEFDTLGSEVWKYVNPVSESGRILTQGESIGDYKSSLNSVFSIQYYSSVFPGFVGRDMTGKGSIEEELVTSIDDVQESPLIYPNPASEFLLIEKQIKQFQLYDLDGHIVLDLINPSLKIDLNAVQPGIYICRVDK